VGGEWFFHRYLAKSRRKEEPGHARGGKRTASKPKNLPGETFLRSKRPGIRCYVSRLAKGPRNGYNQGNLVVTRQQQVSRGGGGAQTGSQVLLCATRKGPRRWLDQSPYVGQEKTGTRMRPSFPGGAQQQDNPKETSAARGFPRAGQGTMGGGRGNAALL